MKAVATFLQIGVAAETKRRFQALADRQEISASTLLRRLVTEFLETEHGPSVALLPELNASLGQVKSDRITVRVLPADRQTLKDRAEARSLRETTYLRMLVRSHVRLAAPVPSAELQALRDSAIELRTISKRLELLTRVQGAGTTLDKTWPAEALALIKACERLRDHVRAYIRANILSWETGHAEARR
jgi:hypothetical protein